MVQKEINLITNNWWSEKRKEVNIGLTKELKYSTPHQTTSIIKIVVNSGVGGAINDKKKLENIVEIIQHITKQKPIITKAHKSIINFNLREGMKIGCKVTLRHKRAWDFLFDLINIYLPQMPNFLGFSPKKFDRNGNYNFGINRLDIFPTIDYNLISAKQGLQITIVFSSSSIEENIKFLKYIDFPLLDK